MLPRLSSFCAPPGPLSDTETISASLALAPTSSSRYISSPLVSWFCLIRTAARSFFSQRSFSATVLFLYQVNSSASSRLS